jgi:hypothetical protein
LVHAFIRRHTASNNRDSCQNANNNQ